MGTYMSKTVTDIQEHLDPVLKKFYDENCSKSVYYLTSFSALVNDIIHNELDDEGDPAQLKKIYRNKKRTLAQKKKRYYASCEQMVETGAWKTDDEHYCFKDIAFNRELFSKEQWESFYPGKTFEDVERERLAEVKVWSESVTSKMIEYPGTEKRTVRSRFLNYQLDLCIDILRVIGELYDFNIERQTFSVMDSLADRSVFGSSRERISVENNKTVIFGDDKGIRRTVITFDESLFEDGKTICSFDSKDQDILSYLIKTTQKYTGSTYPLMIETSTIAHAVAKDPKKKLSKFDYDDVTKRVRKLANATIESFIGDKWNGTCHIVEAARPVNQQGKEYIEYWPSEYLMDEVEGNRITQLPAEARACLENEVARILYHPFMLQRIKMYRKLQNSPQTDGVYEVIYQYEHFLRYVNFGKGNKRNNHAAIIAALEEYKKKEILLKDYTYIQRQNKYCLYFMPLSDIEIQDLKYYFGLEPEIPTSANILGQLVLSDLFSDEDK